MSDRELAAFVAVLERLLTSDGHTFDVISGSPGSVEVGVETVTAQVFILTIERA